MLDPDDVMWAEFQLLWNDFRTVGLDLLVCGRFGLYLKQNWLLQNRDVITVVSMADWRNSAPRATRDFDVIVGLDIIANEKSHRAVRAILNRNGYTPTEKNLLWQFEKTLLDDRTIILDLHAQPPGPKDSGVTSDRYRVKRKPSMGDQGIHARTNPELMGWQNHPYQFELDDSQLQCPIH